MLVPGAVVSVVQPTVATVTVTQPSRALQVVALPAGVGGGSVVGFEWQQTSSAATWTIPLPAEFPSRRPGVDLYINDVLIESDVTWYPLTKTVVVTFPSPISGVAVIT